MSRTVPRRVGAAVVCVVVMTATAACSASITDDSHSTDASSPSPRSSGSSVSSTHGSTGRGVASLASARRTIASLQHARESATVVPVSAGYDAAVFDDAGHLRFYASSDGLHWRQGASIDYPYDARDAEGQHLKVEGQLLAGMAHATFILHGIFSGDGSGNAVAYASSPAAGWGLTVEHTGATRAAGVLTIDADLDTRTTSEQYSYFALQFARGYLEERECGASTSTADCGLPGTVMLTFWKWDRVRSRFVVARTA